MGKMADEVTGLLVDLIKIPSISRDEKEIGNFIFDLLQKLPFDEVEKQTVDENGFNIIARKGKPKVALQAHIDTIPPYISPRVEENKIFGRGACDAKSCVAAMITAAQESLEQGINNFALFFTVGEEIDFRGVQKLVSSDVEIPFTIVGEPTSLEPVNGHFGFENISLVAEGKAAHTSRPEEGENAIEKLLVGLGQLKGFQPQNDSLMTLVEITGGKAKNIVPAEAKATYNFRISPEDTQSDYQRQFKELLSNCDLTVEKSSSLDPMQLSVPAELRFLGSGQTVRYATELSFIKNGLVLGPGDIRYAHSSNEQIKIVVLKKAVRVYGEIITAMA